MEGWIRPMALYSSLIPVGNPTAVSFPHCDKIPETEKKLDWLRTRFMVFSPWSLGPVIVMSQLGHLVKDICPLAAGKRMDRQKGVVVPYLFQGHTINNLTSSHQSLPTNGSTIFQQHQAFNTWAFGGKFQTQAAPGWWERQSAKWKHSCLVTLFGLFKGKDTGIGQSIPVWQE